MKNKGLKAETLIKLRLCLSYFRFMTL